MRRESSRLRAGNRFVGISVLGLAYLALIVALYFTYPTVILICLGIGVVLAVLGSLKRFRPRPERRPKTA